MSKKAKAEEKNEEIKPIITEKEPLKVGSVTVANTSVDKVPVQANENDVAFIVKYPSGFKGEKLMPEGDVIVSKESAEHFLKIGIGSIKC